jgi:hypothetical protein
MKNIFSDTKRYRLIIVRLSLVVGVMAALVDASKVLNYWWEQQQWIQERTVSMNCAARHSNEDLERVRVSPSIEGLYDISQLGCGYGVEGVDFYVSREDLDLHKEGKYVQPNSFPKVDLQSNALSFVAYLLLVNFIGLMVFGAYKVLRWVWGVSASE